MSRLEPLLDALESARCIGVPLETFYPDGRGGRKMLAEMYREAAGVCAGCPVMAECWEYLALWERSAPRPLHGFAAGLRPDERDRIYRQQSAA